MRGSSTNKNSSLNRQYSTDKLTSERKSYNANIESSISRTPKHISSLQEVSDRASSNNVDSKAYTSSRMIRNYSNNNFDSLNKINALTSKYMLSPIYSINAFGTKKQSANINMLMNADLKLGKSSSLYDINQRVASSKSRINGNMSNSIRMLLHNEDVKKGNRVGLDTGRGKLLRNDKYAY
jgi:hypothetical protein